MSHPFSVLVPDVILDAVESTGLWSDSRIYPLNSYENRVYQVGIEDAAPIIAKFYRPQRWQTSQILEEHQALLTLQGKGVSVAAPLLLNGQTLHSFKGIEFALFERISGPYPEADNLDHLFQTGELIGQLHQALGDKPFVHRNSATPIKHIENAAQSILGGPFLPNKLKADYRHKIQALKDLCQASVQGYWPKQLRPIHGDCHRSNIIMRDEQAYLVDFDDCQNGLAVQDLWLHLTQSNNPALQLSELIEGYESYQSFDRGELGLIDVFKCTRIIQYRAWLQQRWQDPAFPKAFPWFASEDAWITHLNELEQCRQDWGQFHL
ncbi:serine/threonine protein kinase [Marinomonas epiphytica]